MTPFTYRIGSFDDDPISFAELPRLPLTSLDLADSFAPSVGNLLTAALFADDATDGMFDSSPFATMLATFSAQMGGLAAGIAALGEARVELTGIHPLV